MKSLSIIVPVFNVSKYLRKCVDSLLAQGLKQEEYEIILVDDGSTDNSGSIADSYASSFLNIHVIHQNNQGLSSARNAGLASAEGEYVQFVDSDDYLQPGTLRPLLEKVYADDLDVLRFNYQNVNESYEIYQPYKDVKPFVDYRDDVCDGHTFLTERLGMGCYAVQFIIRANIIRECLFTPGIYFEDTEWTPRMLLSAERVSSVNTVVYNYLLREGSITRSGLSDGRRKVLEDKYKLIESLCRQAEPLSDRRWFEGMTAHTAKQILESISTDYYSERKSLIARLKLLGIFPLSLFHSTPRVSRKLRIINVSPRIFCLLMHLKSK